MALPLKKMDASVPDIPGPTIVPMPSYDNAADLADSAAEEVEFVLRRASESASRPSATLHDLGKRVASVYDRTMQNAAASSARGIDGLRELAEGQPIRFIAAVAAAAFLMGFGLRLWRSSRA